MKRFFVAVAMFAVLGSANAQTSPGKKAAGKCCEAKKDANCCANKEASHCSSAQKEKAAATITTPKKAANKKG